jgi:hypothetical protein
MTSHFRRDLRESKNILRLVNLTPASCVYIGWCSLSNKDRLWEIPSNIANPSTFSAPVPGSFMSAPWSPEAWTDWNLCHAKIIPPLDLNNSNVPISMGSCFILLNASRIALHSGVLQKDPVHRFTLIWINFNLRGCERGGIKDHLMKWLLLTILHYPASESVSHSSILSSSVLPHTTMQFRTFIFVALSLLVFSECEELLPV